MERKTSLPSFFALAKASGPHGYQSVGLWACIRRYGLVSLASRLVCLGLPLSLGSPAARGPVAIAAKRANTPRRRVRQLIVGSGRGLVGPEGEKDGAEDEAELAAAEDKAGGRGAEAIAASTHGGGTVSRCEQCRHHAQQQHQQRQN